MSHLDSLISEDIIAYLNTQENKSFLRFITCGSVDDGKSTLIGRLLYDSKLIYEDQLAAIEKDSKKSGTQGDKVDLALLVDGLAAEREQGITIDVAYRFFSTDRRKFIVADTPGHEQYTRNMATGASTADVAILLIDCRHGVQVQTRRHAYITSLLGIKKVVVAINKMDLNGFDQKVFNDIEIEFRQFAKALNFDDITCIPMSALEGDNVTTRSDNAPWYRGPTLLEYLETVNVDTDTLDHPFRLPVQWVNRPNLDFRGFAGTVASGTVSAGDGIIVIPSGKRSTVKSIVTYDGELEHAREDQAVTLTLDDEIDISRGDIICKKDDPIAQADQCQAHILWMNDNNMYPGRQYLFKFNNKTVPGSIMTLKHLVDVNDLSEKVGRTLALNEVGVCQMSLSHPVAFDTYVDNRHTGSFIVIDRQTNATVGVGMLDFALRRASNVVWQDLDVSKTERASQKNQKAVVLWFTGLSGCGKSTIANLVEKKLLDLGRHTFTLDGDNVRHGLCRDLGFTQADRVENIRRIGEVAKLMIDSGLITLTSFISPFRSERRMARRLVDKDEFIEIFIDTPLEVCEERDAKGLYARARRGEIRNFTGINSPYQKPKRADIHIKTVETSAEAAAERIVKYLDDRGYLGAGQFDGGPAVYTRGRLTKMSEMDVVALAESMGIEVSVGNPKADTIRKILNKQG
ncbi:MAG: sulfate adenylyltransferase subunit CysN [Hyphomonadaceae bacterium]|nr:sulfate adenylyltransferase subunit CysN [Hyphomonadaceae bacterium]